MITSYPHPLKKDHHLEALENDHKKAESAGDSALTKEPYWWDPFTPEGTSQFIKHGSSYNSSRKLEFSHFVGTEYGIQADTAIGK